MLFHIAQSFSEYGTATAKSRAGSMQMNYDGSVIPVVPSEVQSIQSEELGNAPDQQLVLPSEPSQQEFLEIQNATPLKDILTSQASARPRASSEIEIIRSRQLPDRCFKPECFAYLSFPRIHYSSHFQNLTHICGQPFRGCHCSGCSSVSHLRGIKNSPNR